MRQAKSGWAILGLLLLASIVAPLAQATSHTSNYDPTRSELRDDWLDISSRNLCNEANVGVQSDLRNPTAIRDWFDWLDNKVRADPDWLNLLSGKWDALDDDQRKRMVDEMLGKGEDDLGLQFAAQPDGLSLSNALPWTWPKVFRKANKEMMVAVKIQNAFNPQAGSDYGRDNPAHSFAHLAGDGEYTTLEVVFDSFDNGTRIGIGFTERDANYGWAHSWAFLLSFTGDTAPGIVDVRMFPYGQPALGGYFPASRAAARDWDRLTALQGSGDRGAWGTGSVHWDAFGFLNLTAEPRPDANVACRLQPASGTGGSNSSGGQNQPSAAESNNQRNDGSANNCNDPLATDLQSGQPEVNRTTVQTASLFFDADNRLILNTCATDSQLWVLAAGVDWNASERAEVQQWIESVNKTESSTDSNQQQAAAETDGAGAGDGYSDLDSSSTASPGLMTNASYSNSDSRPHIDAETDFSSTYPAVAVNSAAEQLPPTQDNSANSDSVVENSVGLQTSLSGSLEHSTPTTAVESFDYSEEPWYAGEVTALSQSTAVPSPLPLALLAWAVALLLPFAFTFLRRSTKIC